MHIFSALFIFGAFVLYVDWAIRLLPVLPVEEQLELFPFPDEDDDIPDDCEGD